MLTKSKKTFRIITFAAVCMLLGNAPHAYGLTYTVYGIATAVSTGYDNTHYWGEAWNKSEVRGRYITVRMDVYDKNGNHVIRKEGSGIDSAAVTYYANVQKGSRMETSGSLYWEADPESGIMETVYANEKVY